MKYLLGMLLLFGSPAMAADIFVPLEAEAPARVEAYNWSGIYAGGQLGWGNGGHDLGLADDCRGEDIKRGCFPGAGLSGLDATNDWIGGLRGGFDWQFGQFILGARGTYNWSGGFDTDGYVGDFVSIHGEIGDIYTIDGKVGYSPANIDRMQVYAFGGWAHTDVTGSLRIGDDMISRTVDMDGWDAGLGIEFAMMDNVTFFLEGTHYDFGSSTFGVNGLTVDTTLDTVQAGVNIRFGPVLRNAFSR